MRKTLSDLVGVLSAVYTFIGVLIHALNEAISILDTVKPINFG
jgi:hypothetical protein